LPARTSTSAQVFRLAHEELDQRQVARAKQLGGGIEQQRRGKAALVHRLPPQILDQ
jgi:hypothetical protein